MKKKTIPVSLSVLMVVLMWVVSASADTRSLRLNSAAMPPALAAFAPQDDEPENSPPVADPLTVDAAENATTDITLTGSDPDGDPLTFDLVSSPEHGQLSGTIPNLVYAPDADYSGPDSFTFKVSDGAADSEPAVVAINVQENNAPPTAEDDSVTLVGDAPAQIELKASDPDDDDLTYVIVEPPANGILSGDGATRTYTPNGGYHGPDGFTFKVTDGAADSDSAVVAIIVEQDNTAPTADDQNVAVDKNKSKVITLVGNDPEDDPLTYIIVDGPDNGALGSVTANQVTYTPNQGYSGSDTFTFKVTDSLLDSNVATVSITISNKPPVANGQSLTVAKNGSLLITFSGSDPDGDPLTYEIPASSANGTLTGSGATRTYEPNDNFTGSDSFTFRVNDGEVNSTAATVTIQVNNTAPTANPQTVTVQENGSKAITLTGSDQNGDPLTYKIEDGPQHGELDDDSGQIITYTPEEDYVGTDSFTFVVNDGTSDSPKATVNITVTSTNKAPTANPQTVNVTENGSKIITLTGSDPDGDELDFEIVEDVEDGELTGSGNTYTYTPDNGFTGQDSFTFKVDDGEAESAPATVTINVTPVNDPPVVDLNGGGPGTGFSTVIAAGGQGQNIAASNMTLTDPDDTHLTSATITIKNIKHVGGEFLDVAPVPPTVNTNFNQQSGVLTITGANNAPIPVGQMLSILKSVTYRILPTVTNPNTNDDRVIEVVVNDGEANSNTAVATVEVIAPRISIVVTTPASNVPIPVGSKTTFTVTITNNANSNVNLGQIVVASPSNNQPASTCGRNLTGITLVPGESHTYPCVTTDNVESGYNHTFSVVAKDQILNTDVTASTSARVRVVAPIVIEVYHKAGGTTLLVGEDANFRITITSPSAAPLEDVSSEATIRYYDIDTGSYSDFAPLPACSKDDLGDLTGGDYVEYDCSIPDVEASFEIQVKATGLLDGLEEKEDIDGKEISVIDLALEVSAEPFAVNSGTPTAVTFSMTLTNRSKETLTLTSLVSNHHGDLLVEDYSKNTCPGINTTIPENTTRDCSYEIVLTIDTLAFVNSFTATAKYAGNKTISVTDEAIVLTGDIEPLDLVLTANPSSIVAPGGTTQLTVQVINNTSTDLTIDQLIDSELGDLDNRGDCDVPKLIMAGEYYTCTYPVTVSGVSPGDVISHTVTASAGAAEASSTVAISITTVVDTTVLLPTITKLGRFGEPHNNACAAMPIMPNHTYFALPDDQWDFYRITTTAPSRLIVHIKNFMVTDGGQLLVYYTANCQNLSSAMVGHNGDNGLKPERTLDLEVRPAGTYYIAVYVKEAFNSQTPYQLYIQATAP